jgi:glycosyltransferase involved in cell wall biosynthesis
MPSCNLAKKNDPEVILVGYSESLDGGVVSVTKVLKRVMPMLKLHVYLHCYYPKYKQVLLYFVSVIAFAFRIVLSKKKPIIHLVIASRGDLFRALIFIVLSKLRGLVICAQYHKNAEAIFSGSARSVVSRLTFLFLSWVDAHCFLSVTLKNRFERFIPFDIKSFIVQNALPDEWMGLSTSDYTKRKKDVVFFGRWNSEKGVDDLMEAVGQLSDFCNFEVYSSHLPDYPGSNCTFKPWANEKEVRSIMSQSKLLVLPSYAEAYPTVLLEALACGTPFVASDVGGVADISGQSLGGLIYPVGDVRALVSGIKAIVEDEERWSSMSSAGYEWVNENNSASVIREKWLSIYRELAA